MSHYYKEQQTSELKLRKVKAILRNHEFEFYTGSGVFSIKKIDKGSEILINKCIIEPESDILDLGCGYGAIGIAIKKTFPDTKITMTDINKRAIKLAKMNLKLNNATAKVLHGNLYEPVKGMKFDTILTNPPFKAGRKLCFQIIEEAKQHLKKGGAIQLVAPHNKGGKVLKEKIQEVFGNVKDLAKKSGFRVYIGVL
ncbi:class I SAM-dependent methyltransferase [Candidatus Woesearchaeota archaeon]|nr:class I SAM-dependent methyltransferase [Candidatus Woesearchaeota archaeon]